MSLLSASVVVTHLCVLNFYHVFLLFVSAFTFFAIKSLTSLNCSLPIFLGSGICQSTNFFAGIHRRAWPQPGSSANDCYSLYKQIRVTFSFIQSIPTTVLLLSSNIVSRHIPFIFPILSRLPITLNPHAS